ncbi:MAG: pyridoxal-dependent decarboxylase, partial [Proteobacteria bacterium]|nr:pyridoxal-dependent decarboxylase [Pseudomonadota bacterium]
MSVPPAIAAAYNPERFRADGHRLIDALADQLARWHARTGPVLPWQPPAQARDAWAAEPLEGGHDLVDDLVRIAAASTALADPRVLGHQVSPPVPSAVLAELTAALLNNGTSVYEMGPAAAPIELATIAWMARALGMPAGAGGVMTSGGSLGNLTALLAMRQAHAGFDVWTEGAHAGPPLAVVTSSEAHYSIARTLRVMGWGEGGAIAAPV